MKKILFLILPSLFLVLGAGKDISSFNTKNDAQNKQMLSDLKNLLESSKKDNEKENIQKESPDESESTEIAFNQEVVIQAADSKNIRKLIFKLNLPEQEEFKLVDPKTRYTTDDDQISWQWNELSGQYIYKLTIKLVPEQNYVLIITEPIERRELGLPFVAFTFVKKGDIIYLNGESFGMTSHSFTRAVLAVE